MTLDSITMRNFLIVFLMVSPMLSVGQFYWFINFDDGQNMTYLRIDTSNSSNIWQIGNPQKSFFTEAYSVPNVIVTDTVNPYPTNNLSSFYIYIPASPDPMIMGQEISFYYKINADTLSDFGKIEYSFDKGINWHNLMPQTDSLFILWSIKQGYPPYTRLFGNPDTINPFTGKSSGWCLFEMSYMWPYWPFTIDTVYYRFSFHSDGIQTHKDGWMLDDFFIGDVAEDIEENSIQDVVSVVPNPFQTEFILNIRSKKQQNLNEKFTYEIFSIQGKRIIEREFYGRSIKIEELSKTGPGIYFLRIKTDTQSIYFKKIVKIN